jgi:protein-S-isoprenylcysteine O-methyltransferase Ste14
MSRDSQTNVPLEAPRVPRQRLPLTLVLDIVERMLVAGWYGNFAFKFLTAFLHSHSPIDLMLVVSEGSIVAFILIRRLTNRVSLRPLDWVLAVGGTVAPLCVLPASGAVLAPPLVCLAIMFMGLSLQIAAKLTLRRRFGIVAANRGVEISGPYRAIRHPMYADYTLTEIGFFLANASLWNAAVYLIAFSFQVSRILVEERVLAQDPAYREFMGRVPYRLIPRVF